MYHTTLPPFIVTPFIGQPGLNSPGHSPNGMPSSLYGPDLMPVMGIEMPSRMCGPPMGHRGRGNFLTPPHPFNHYSGSVRKSYWQNKNRQQRYSEDDVNYLERYSGIFPRSPTPGKHLHYGEQIVHRGHNNTYNLGNKGVKRQLEHGQKGMKGPNERRSQSPGASSQSSQDSGGGYQHKRRSYSVQYSPGYRSPRTRLRPDPDNILTHSPFNKVVEPPPQLLQGGEWDRLSEAIWKKFIAHQQTPETFRKKMELWKELYLEILEKFPYCRLYVVGSTMSGFGSNCSDMDMCLLLGTEFEHRNEAIFNLKQVLSKLRRCEYIEKLELIRAKVPILKFRDVSRQLEVDLNCNNAVGIRNTHLLYCYSQLDWRVRSLVLIVKLWAQKHDINDAKNMTVSSYSLVLMVIHYLQCGTSPPVLPCLHRMYPRKFMFDSAVHQIDIHEELSVFTSENKQTLGELLVGFLEYYSNSNKFNFSKDAISVRMANKRCINTCRMSPVSYKNEPHQWKYLCIEEPFDLTNTARSVYDERVFDKIKAVFRTSWTVLQKTRDLNSIFVDLKLESPVTGKVLTTSQEEEKKKEVTESKVTETESKVKDTKEKELKGKDVREKEVKK